MKIVHVPHPVLTQKVQPVGRLDRKVRVLVHDMVVMLEKEVNPEGVGLAANQVGLPLGLFIMKPTKKAPVTVCINPTIISLAKAPKPRTPVKTKAGNKKNRSRARLEGCLSIPSLWGYVERSPRVTLEYTDLEGKKLRRIFSGFEAVIVQHEMDHLQGVMFTQRVLEQKRKLYQEVEGELEALRL